MATKRPKPVHQMTEGQFEAAFPDEDACKTYLVARRWPDGVHCPRCGAVKSFPVGSMAFKWQCYQCAPDQRLSLLPIAGTIFENTNKPLREWFKVVHLMLVSKKGISSLQIQRQMGFGSYETALEHVPQNPRCDDASRRSSVALSRLTKPTLAAKTRTDIGTRKRDVMADGRLHHRRCAAQGQRRGARIGKRHN